MPVKIRTKPGLRKISGRRLPVIIQRSVDGFYVDESPLLEGSYSQGSTIDEARRNIREAIPLVPSEKEAKALLSGHGTGEISIHAISV